MADTTTRAASPGSSQAFAPAIVVGELVYTSGQLPLEEGELSTRGLLGDEVSRAEGARLARVCTAHALEAVSTVADPARIEQIVKLTGFIASAPGFRDQPAVMDGASAMLRERFGGAGRHARSAIGVASLPRDAPVEMELIVRLRPL